MNKLPKNACVYPFKGAMLMHGLPATPCCRFHNRFLDEADTESVDAYGATFADIRETMMRNEWHPGCYKCKAKLTRKPKARVCVLKLMSFLTTLQTQ